MTSVHKIIDYQALSKYDEQIKKWFENQQDATRIAKLVSTKKMIYISPEEWVNSEVTKDIEINEKFDVSLSIPESENTDNYIAVSNASIVVTKHKGSEITLKCLNDPPAISVSLIASAYVYSLITDDQATEENILTLQDLYDLINNKVNKEDVYTRNQSDDLFLKKVDTISTSELSNLLK